MSEGATCLFCGKELFDKHNMSEHFFNDHKELFNNPAIRKYVEKSKEAKK